MRVERQTSDMGWKKFVKRSESYWLWWPYDIGRESETKIGVQTRVSTLWTEMMKYLSLQHPI